MIFSFSSSWTPSCICDQNSCVEQNKTIMSNKDENEDNNIREENNVDVCSMHPDSYLFKGVGLLFICSIGFGSYFCYDNPAALEVIYKKKQSFVIAENISK